MAAQHDQWRTLGKPGRNIVATDHSTAAIEHKLKTPRSRDVTESHVGVASIGVDGAKPTQHPCDNCGPNEAANAAFNDQAQGPREVGYLGNKTGGR